MTVPTNLFAGLTNGLPGEMVDILLNQSGVRIERIVSCGQTSPDGFWYDQAEHEWVVVLSGAARIAFEGESSIELMPGSFMDIPAHRRHRVDWTDPTQPTVWLAVFYPAELQVNPVIPVLPSVACRPVDP